MAGCSALLLGTRGCLLPAGQACCALGLSCRLCQACICTLARSQHVQIDMHRLHRAAIGLRDAPRNSTV